MAGGLVVNSNQDPKVACCCRTRAAEVNLVSQYLYSIEGFDDDLPSPSIPLPGGC